MFAHFWCSGNDQFVNFSVALGLELEVAIRVRLVLGWDPGLVLG